MVNILQKEGYIYKPNILHKCNLVTRSNFVSINNRFCANGAQILYYTYVFRVIHKKLFNTPFITEKAIFLSNIIFFFNKTF